VATIALALHFARAFTYRSGGGLNPAIAIGLELWMSIHENDFSYMINFYIFLVGPLIGGFTAAIYYRFVHIPNLDPKAVKAEEVKKDEEIDQEIREEPV